MNSETKDMVKNLLITILSLLLVNSLTAQHADMRFKRISISEGLSQVLINSIIQDKEGFIWIATHDGLNKYDGYTFKVFKPDSKNQNSISNNQIKVVYEDKQGYIWVGTGSGGLCRFDKKSEKFTTYTNNEKDPNSISADAVYSVFEDSKGRLWVGTFGGGLNLFNRTTGKFKKYQPNILQHSSLGCNAVRVILEDHKHRLWIGLDGGGLDLYNEKTDDFTHFKHNPNNPNSLSNDVVLAILEDKENYLWIGTYDGGLNRFNPETKTFEQFHTDSKKTNCISSETVWSIFEYDANTLWFGTRGGGLCVYNKKEKSFCTYTNSQFNKYTISEDRILSMRRDKSGLIWLGTEGAGLNIFDPQSSSFNLYKYNSLNTNSISNDIVMSIRQQGDINWIATRAGGLNAINSKDGKITRYQNSQSSKFDMNQLNSLEIASDGKLWLGSDINGIFLFDPKTNQAQNYRYDPNFKKNQISNNAITSIIPLSDSIIWISTWGGGLNKFNFREKVFTNIPIAPSNSRNVGWCMYKDKFGMLWVGTNGNGLLQINPQNGDKVFYANERNNPKSLSNNVVYYIMESSDGLMWLGTGGGGINKFDREKQVFTSYTMKDGLPNDMVMGILEDGRKNLWVSTSNGLCKFDPRKIEFTNYYEGNGTQGDAYNERACFKNNDGKMFFGGPKGLTAFYPDSLMIASNVPAVVITDFKILGKSVKVSESIENYVVLSKPIYLTDSIVLSYKHSVISFEFAALHYVSSMRNKYQYKLEGFDEHWINADASQRIATYTNLPGGNYVFRVRASNSEGEWNNKGATLYIHIIPPFYKTIWFYIVILTFLAFIVYTYIRRREKRLLKKREHVELAERTALLQVEAEKLKESEDKFRKMFLNHNAVMLLLDPVFGRVVDANSSACKFYKYSHEQLCSMMIQDIYVFENGLELQLMKQSIVENQNKTIYTHRLGDGTKRIVEVDSAPLDTKNEHYFFSIIYDITERKQAEDALIESYEFNESLLQTIPFGMQIVDEDGNVLFMSVKLKDVFGIEALGEKCWNLYCDKKTQCEYCPLKNKIKFGVTTITEAHNMMNGKIFQIYHTGMMYDRKKAILEIFHDITDRKLAEKEAEEVSTRLSLATLAGGVGVWDYDLVSNRLLWDDQMFVLYGIEKETFNNEFIAWKACIHPDEIERFDKEFELAILSEKEFNIEFRICLPNGGIRIIRAIAIVQYDELAFPIRMIGTCWDITEQKTLEIELIKSKESAEAASVAKSDFLATMSHEIRTPLNGVIGFSDILMKTKLSEKQFEYMKNVHVSANSLLDLVNDILDFSKIEAGKLELNPEKVDIIELAGNIVEIMKFKVSEKGIELLLNISPTIPRFIFADPIRIRQVLINLLGNASKFTDKGEIELRIEASPIEGNDKELNVTFSVRDTGIGIPKNKQQSIFESFSQADSSTTRKYGGTGLGLAISSNLVQKMGSHIKVESEEWVGSTFFFTVQLPFEHGETVEPYDIDWVKKVLVIDDNATNRHIIEAMLRPHNIITDEAANGLLALEMIEKNNDYDVIIVDYHMPYIDGLEVMTNIRKNEAIKNQNLVFLHSSSDDETVFAECKKLEVKHVLQKPLRMVQLFRTITKIHSNNDCDIEIVQKETVDINTTKSDRKFTILIVDDNQMNLNLASSLVTINMPNAEIIETKQGTEAVKLYLKHKPDMVLMDIQMPIMNGYEASTAIREVEKSLGRRIPIIALTAGTVSGEKERCIAAGMDDYLAKPLNSKLLFQAFDKYLNGNTEVTFTQPKQTVDSMVHFDRNELLEKYDNEEDFVNTFLSTAFETMPQYINDLNEAIKNADVKQIKFNAHSIKGMARGICFYILTDYALKLEKGSESDLEECSALFILLKKEFEYLKKEYGV